MLRAELRSHVDMRDVVTRRRVDAVERLEEHPVLAERSGDLVEARSRVVDEAVRQLPTVVAGVRVIEAGVAFEDGLAADVALLRERDGEHGVPDGRALAQRAATAARRFGIAGREARAQSDGAVHLVLGEAHHLRGGDGGAEDAEHGAGVEATRHHRGDEVGRHALRDFVACHEAGDEVLAGRADRLGGDERARDDAGARMRQHAERVPLAAREHHLRVGERRAALRHPRPVHQDGGALLDAGLFLGDELHGIDHRRREIVVAETSNPLRELSTQRRHR